MTDTTDTADKNRHKLRMCRRDRDAKRKQNTKLLRERSRLERENATLRAELENLKVHRHLDDPEDTKADLIAEQRRHNETLDKLDATRAELCKVQAKLALTEEWLRQEQTKNDTRDTQILEELGELNITASAVPALGRGPTHLPEQSSSAGMRRFFPWFRKP